MAALGSKLRTITGGLMFWCPGCDTAHGIKTDPGGWKWNGNIERPTFTPSVLVRSGHFVPGHEKGECWCTYKAEHQDEDVRFWCGICHSFVTAGNIQYLSDCTHALMGKTLPLPDFP